MEWEDYFRSYRLFEVSINQSIIVAEAASYALSNFPKRLPRKWQVLLKSAEKQFFDTAESFIIPDQEERLIDAYNLFNSIAHDHNDTLDIFRPAFLVNFNTVLLNNEDSKVQFSEAVYAQLLVMIFAHLDAFLTDTIRAICVIQPNVLKSQKQMDWASIIALGNWDALFETMTEKFVYEYGFKGVVKRIEKMQKDFGIKPAISEFTLLKIEVAEYVRNLLIHNGGRVNHEFLQLTKDLHFPMKYLPIDKDSTDLNLDESFITAHSWIATSYSREDSDSEEEPKLEIGKKLICGRMVARGIAECSRIIAGEIFIAVSQKFYDKSATNVGVMREWSD
jgi:hypothetical protein